MQLVRGTAAKGCEFCDCLCRSESDVVKAVDLTMVGSVGVSDMRERCC